MATCTGKCCTQVVISRSRVELRREVDRTQSGELALIWALLRPTGEKVEDGRDIHRCVALGESGCVLSYADRPWMCSAYPYGEGYSCWACGARSDQEARGVALARLT